MMTFKTRVAAATGPRLVHLLVAIVPVMLAAPAGAQLQEALTAQVAADKQGAEDQATVNGIRDRTRDAAGRYAQAMADSDSLDRYNNQLQEQVQARSRRRSRRSSASSRKSKRPTAKCSR